MNRVLTLCGITLSALIFMPSPSIDADIYKWKDASGQMHYSSTPPEDIESDKVTKKVVQVTKTEQSAPKKQDEGATDNTQDKTADISQNEQDDTQANNDQASKGYCERQQKIVNTLKANPYIKWQVDDKEILLEGEKKTEKIKEITNEMAQFCSPNAQEPAS